MRTNPLDLLHDLPLHLLADRPPHFQLEGNSWELGKDTYFLALLQPYKQGMQRGHDVVLRLIGQGKRFYEVFEMAVADVLDVHALEVRLGVTDVGNQVLV